MKFTKPLIIITIVALASIPFVHYAVTLFSKDSFNYTSAREALLAAHSYETSGRKDKAESTYLKALEMFKDDPLVLSESAKFYLREKEDLRAEDLARLMKERFPARAESYLLLAVLKIKKNRLVEAYGLCRTALELEPGNDKARALFEHLERIKNKPAKDAWFVSEEEDERFAGAVSSLMRENITLNRE